MENGLSFPSIAVILLLGFATSIAVAALQRGLPKNVRLLGPVLVSFAVAGAAVICRVILDPVLVSDEVTWHHQSVAVADYLLGREDLPTELHGGKEGYPWVVGVLYAATEPAPLVAIMLGLFLFVLLVPLVGSLTSHAAREFGFTNDLSLRAIRFACYFSALCPATVIWVPRMLRETMCMCLVAIIMLAFLRFVSRPAFAPLMALTLAALLMLSVRAQVAIGVVAGLILSGMVAYTNRFRSPIARIAVIAPVSAGMFMATWTYVDSTADLSLESLALRNQALADASSGFEGSGAAYQAGSIVDIVLFNLPRIAFGPFPQEIDGSGVMLLAAISNVFWLFCVAGAIVPFLLWRRRWRASFPSDGRFPRSVTIMGVVSLTLLAILSITAGNYGLVVRMRLMPFVPLIATAALGFALWRNRKYQIVAR